MWSLGNLDLEILLVINEKRCEEEGGIAEENKSWQPLRPTVSSDSFPGFGVSLDHDVA